MILPRLIIVEGPDGGGKSALVSQLAEYLGRPPVVHHGPYQGLNRHDLFWHYVNSVTDHHGEQFLIFDRSWLSEPIYGRVLRDGSRLGCGDLRMLDRLALGCNALVVLCLPPLETCRLNCEQRDKDAHLLRHGRLRKVYERYANLLAHSQLKLEGYDYTTDDVRKLLVTIDERGIYNNHGPGVGHWGADIVLLVGDRANVDLYQPALPFINPDGCSAWLAEQIAKAGVNEDDLYWINAVDGHGREVDLNFIEELKPRRIIALGQQARDSLARVGYQAALVPHPQFWKRFNYSQPYPLIKLLKEIR